MLKTRLAPTPSGYLHIGNAFSFLLAWLVARKQAGSVHLRIDDIDSDRVRDVYRQDALDMLGWLGLDWDTQSLSQIPKIAQYTTYLTRLKNLPACLYACKCSRKDIQENQKNGLYGQTCLPLKVSLPANLRLHIPAEATVEFHDVLAGKQTIQPAELAGDLVVWRKNNAPAYQLASVVDDIKEGVNFIVRGKDLWKSTAFQYYLAKVLGEESFENICFLHHELVLDSSGDKLSKSAGSDSLHAFREQNGSPTEIYKQFAVFWNMQNISQTPTLQELLDKFAAIL